MITPYLAQQPVTDFGFRLSDLMYSATLGAASNTTLTVPGGAPRYKAVIKVTAATYMAINKTATVPAGSSFAATNSELINISERECREVKAGEVLNFITAHATTDVSVQFFALGTNN